MYKRVPVARADDTLFERSFDGRTDDINVSLVIVVETFRVRNYAAFILESSCFPCEEII
jgi:hypothetical protein